MSGTAKNIALGLYDGLVEAISNPEDLVLSDSKGSAADRQLVAELQGNTDAAGQEAADVFMDTLGEYALPGVGRLATGTVKEVTEEAVELAARRVDVDGDLEGVTDVANPLPDDNTYARVMPKEYAENFQNGVGTIGSPNSDEVFITSGNSLADINTPEGAQESLSLFKNFDGTVPNTDGDVVVEFKLKDPTAVGIRSPIETDPARGYGFEQGGVTQGEIPEWNINNGTAGDIGATDIKLRLLDGSDTPSTGGRGTSNSANTSTINSSEGYLSVWNSENKSFLSTGETVHYNENSTAIGNDDATIDNFIQATDTGKGHNVIVHGSTPDYDEQGGFFIVDDIPMNSQQIVDALKSNPNYEKGTPVCLGSCWSASNGTAQEVANALGVKVTAPTRPVRFNEYSDEWEQMSDSMMMRQFPELIHIKPEVKVFNPEDK